MDHRPAPPVAQVPVVAPVADDLPCALLALAADGTVLQANAALGLLVGRDPQTLLDRPFDGLLSVASRVLYQSYLLPLLRLHGHLTEFSMSLRAADGTAVEVLLFANSRSSAGVTIYDLVLVPIRQRRRLEEEMLRVKRAADESPDMIFQLMCLPDGSAHFPYASEAVRPLYGCTPMAAQHSAEAVFCQLPADDRARLLQALTNPAASDAPWRDCVRVNTRDGRLAWHDWSATPRRLASGVVLWHGHVADVSQRRAMEDALAERQAAEQASRAKSEFLARVSHELRTPLNGILGFTQLLRSERAENLRDEQRQRLAVVHGAGNALLGLINEVLDITSIEMGQLSLQLQPLPLADAVERSLQVLRGQAGLAGVELHGPGAVDLLALADERRLQQVLVNLLGNAIKYSPRGGRVTVSVSAARWPDAAEAADVGAAGRAVCVAVTDAGPGLSDEQQRHLFEPFNRLGAERSGIEGTGLGLAISQQLAVLMKGCIRVRSAPGAGCVFELLLPRSDTEPPPQPALPLRSPGGGSQAAALPAPGPVAKSTPTSAPTTAPTPTPTPTRGRVLYVEDNPVNVLLMEAILGLRPGLQLQVAVDMAQGMAAALADPPDLLLLDMQLPDGDGASLLQALRKHPSCAQVPAVAVSAAARADDLARAREVGFAAYWTKPVVVDDVLAALDRLLAHRPT